MPPIRGFVIANFVLAGLCAMWILLMTAVLVYGVVFSGDRGEELALGVLGAVILAAPGAVGFPVYLAAGLGLARRRAWGYYFHCGGSFLAALSCIGVVYTVFAMVFALRPDFTAAFFAPADVPE